MTIEEATQTHFSPFMTSPHAGGAKRRFEGDNSCAVLLLG
jgi:hypothetical protein